MASACTLEYQRLSTHIRDLKTTINYQQQILTHRNIPGPHQPKNLKTCDTNITKQFEKDYESLFFDYLNKAIINNNIQLELYKAALAAISSQEVDAEQNNTPDSKIRKRGRRGHKRKQTTPTPTLPPPKKPHQIIFYTKAPHHHRPQPDNT